MSTSKFAVIGAGAMGSLYGGRLAAAGYEVSLIDTWAEHVGAINEHGLTIQSATGLTKVELPAATDPAQLDPVDFAIVFVDANHTAQAAETAASILKPDGSVQTLQNGIGNFEALADVLGESRVMAGLSFASAAVKGPGIVRHTHSGPTWLGERDGSSSARLATLAEAIGEAGLNPNPVDNIVSVIWDKWILNCSINAICAITGLREGEIPRTPEVETFQDRILDEIYAVVDARQIELSGIDGRAQIKEQCWKKFNKPSMQQHMEAGKQTEIDALNGRVVRYGREAGVPTPFNEALVAMIKGRQKSQRQRLREETIDYEAWEARVAAGEE